MRPCTLLTIALPLSLLASCGPKPKGSATPDEPQAAAALSPEAAAAVTVEDPPRLASEDPHGFSVVDLLDALRIGDPQLSPDGQRVVFSVRRTDLGGNRSRSDLYLVAVAGGDPVRLTQTEVNESAARFAPDGSLLYLASVDGVSTLFRRGVAVDDKPAVVRTFALPVGGLIVAPDGKSVVVSADVFADCAAADVLGCTKDRLDKLAQVKRTGKGYDGLFLRHWDTWKDGRRSHLFVASLDDSAPRDLTQGLDADVPSKPFGGLEEVTFSPDGKHVVYGARVEGASEPWSTNFDLYAVAVDGSAAAVNLTADNKAWDTGPTFSPDGKTLAYLAMERPGFEADRFRVVVRSFPDGEPRVVTQDWDRSVGSMAFDPDGKSLWVTAGDTGQVSVFQVDVASGKVAPVLGKGTHSLPLVAGDRLVFTRNDLSGPDELYSAAKTGEDIKALTSLNTSRLAAARRGEYEQFTFKGARGDIVHAYLVKPADFDPDKTYPVAFLIHGGPQGSFGNRFHYRWNPQVYAGAGYAAIMVDFHGSTGYGQGFTDAIRKDWGGKPLEDLRKGLAHALKEYSFLDSDRMCALGASYGGYMINWIAGKWSDRFACLVNHDGVFDMRSMYYSTEELWFPEWEHGGPYYDSPRSHEKHNPALHVKNWKTPMLVIHGSLDYRVPLEQGLSAYTALARQGVPARFLHFPDENHWVLAPQNSVQWHEEVLGWLDRYTEAK